MRGFVLSAALLLPSAAVAACADQASADAKAAAVQAGALPGLASLREAVLAAAQQAGRGDVSCDPVGQGPAGENLQCYKGSQVAVIGQAPRLVEGVPLLMATIGDGVMRRIDAAGVHMSGNARVWPHLEGKPLVSALRARQLFCEAMVGGDESALVRPINATEEDKPRAVPAIYHPSQEERRPRLYQI